MKGHQGYSSISRAEFDFALNRDRQEEFQGTNDELDLDISGMLDSLDVQELPNENDIPTWTANSDACCGGRNASEFDIQSNSTFISYLPEPIDQS